MKYKEGQCEECKHSRPKPLDSVTFLCFADTGSKYGNEDIVSKRNKAKRKCRYFTSEKEEKEN